MRLTMIRSTSLAVALCLGVGCSGSEQEVAAPKPVLSVFEAPAEGPGDGGIVIAEANSEREFGVTPVVERVGFDPLDPESRERFRAVASVSGDWSSLQYIWTRNGERFGPNSAEIVLPRLETGDRIAVRVTPYQNDDPGEAFVAERIVRNQRPLLRGLSVERVTESEGALAKGEVWRAVVRAEDPDHDAIEFEYRWLVNGEESWNQDEFFPAAELRAGDRLELRARAFDGRAWSVAAHSGQIEVGNSLPVIVSRPPRPDATGFFRYDVRVEDTDGTKDVRFSLRKSPRGMAIDEMSGLVTWRPDTDQAGRHEVEVVVRDGDGGEATQSFSLALVASVDGESAPAAQR